MVGQITQSTFLSVVCLGCLQNSMSVKPQIFLASCHCCIVLCQSISAGFFRIVQRLWLVSSSGNGQRDQFSVVWNLSSKDPSPVSGCSDLLFSAYTEFYFAPWWLLCSYLLLQLSGNWIQKKWQNSLWLAALGLIFALIATPLYKMQSTDQYVYWTSNGFFSIP